MKPDEAALCDLLEVTRRVMLPAKDNGTFWCEGVNPLRMCEWALSVRAQTAAPGSHDVLEPTDVAPHPSPSEPPRRDRNDSIDERPELTSPLVDVPRRSSPRWRMR